MQLAADSDAGARPDAVVMDALERWEASNPDLVAEVLS